MKAMLSPLAADLRKLGNSLIKPKKYASHSVSFPTQSGIHYRTLKEQGSTWCGAMEIMYIILFLNPLCLSGHKCHGVATGELGITRTT